MLNESIVNIQDWAEKERKFRKWEHVLIIGGHQEEGSVFVCVSKNGDIRGRAGIFEWTWNLETVESKLLTGQPVALIPTD